MVTKQPERHWTVEEVHGLWWAYLPPKPALEQFITHGTRPSNLIGPFHCREFAEEQVAKKR
jgi:hypothetical protein